jgi:hypothetical protein
MAQRLKDFFILLKNDVRTQVLTAIGVIFFGAMIYTLLQPLPQRTQQLASEDEDASKNQTQANAEAYQDLIVRFKSELSDMQTVQTDQRQEIHGIRKDLEEYDERTATILSKILQRVASIDSAGGNAGGDIPVEPIALDENGEGMTSADNQQEGIKPFGGIDQNQPVPPPSPTPSKVAFVGIGDSVRVKLLAAVNAPTDGTPYPTLFKLSGDVTGPDGTKLPLGEARLVAAAQGSLTDSRVLFRLTDMSVRMPNGRRFESKVDGWVVGEDGIRGMPGILIDKIGEALVAGTLVGGVAGFGEGLSASQVTTYNSGYGGVNSQVTGDALEYGLGQAVAGGADVWRDILQERVRAMVPHVQIYSGREGTAVFSESFEIPGLYEALADEEAIYAALD